MKGATYAIQGFGNVGYHTGYYAHKAGAKIVAVSTVDVAIYNENGLDMEAIIKEFQTKGSSPTKPATAKKSAMPNFWL